MYSCLTDKEEEERREAPVARPNNSVLAMPDIVPVDVLCDDVLIVDVYV